MGKIEETSRSMVACFLDFTRKKDPPAEAGENIDDKNYVTARYNMVDTASHYIDATHNRMATNPCKTIYNKTHR